MKAAELAKGSAESNRTKVGKVTRKRVDSYGREIQIGLRFVF
mgnify:CR=1 FL=1